MGLAIRIFIRALLDTANKTFPRKRKRRQKNPRYSQWASQSEFSSVPLSIRRTKLSPGKEKETRENALFPVGLAIRIFTRALSIWGAKLSSGKEKEGKRIRVIPGGPRNPNFHPCPFDMGSKTFPGKRGRDKRKRVILSRGILFILPRHEPENPSPERKKDVKKRRIPGGAFGTLTKLS